MIRSKVPQLGKELSKQQVGCKEVLTVSPGMPRKLINLELDTDGLSLVSASKTTLSIPVTARMSRKAVCNTSACKVLSVLEAGCGK